MKVYKHRRFYRWLRSERLSDSDLKKAVNEINNGLHDGNLGSGLYKKRIAMFGRGKRSGYRTLLAFKQEQCIFFIYGFAKNVRANITEQEKKAYQKLAQTLLCADKKMIEDLLRADILIEVE